jgi:hypothetical protein
MQDHSNSETAKLEKDGWGTGLAPFLALWKRLHVGMDQAEKATKTESDPIGMFFELEISNAFELVKRIHSDMDAISKVIKGAAALTTSIKHIADALSKGYTPERCVSNSAGTVRGKGPSLRNCISRSLSERRSRCKR